MSSDPKTTVSQSIASFAGFSYVNKNKDDDTQPVSSDDVPQPGPNDDFLPDSPSNEGVPELSSDDDDEKFDFNMDITMRVTVDFMGLCEEAFREKDSILRPADPRIENLIFDTHDLSAGAHDQCSLH